MFHFVGRVDLAEEVEMNDLTLRAAMLAEEGDIILYDIERPLPEGYIEMLARNGIGGADFVGVRTNGSSLFDATRADTGLMEFLRQKIRANGEYMLKPFCSSPDAHLLAQALDCNYFGTVDDTVVLEMNNKARARDFFREELGPDSIVKGTSCFGPMATMAFVHVYLENGPVIAKLKLEAASSTGFIRIDSADDLATVVKKDGDKKITKQAIIEALGEDEEVLVEQYIHNKKSSPSIIGEVYENGTHKILAVTDQNLNENDKFTGSTLVSQKLSKRQLKRAEDTGHTLFRGLAKKKYVGWAGFDFIQTFDGRLLPVECNGRCTAAMFPEVVHRQRKNEKDVTHCGNFPVAKGMTFAVAQKRIDQLSLRGGERVLLHNVRCLPNGGGSAIVQAATMNRIAIIFGDLNYQLSVV